MKHRQPRKLFVSLLSLRFHLGYNNKPVSFLLLPRSVGAGPVMRKRLLIRTQKRNCLALYQMVTTFIPAALCGRKCQATGCCLMRNKGPVATIVLLASKSQEIMLHEKSTCITSLQPHSKPP